MAQTRGWCWPPCSVHASPPQSRGAPGACATVGRAVVREKGASQAGGAGSRASSKPSRAATPGHPRQAQHGPLPSQWFQSTVAKEDSVPEALKMLIFPNFEPLHKFHTNFLKEIEQRLALW